MGQNQLLCYKLCYILGVTEETLYLRFRRLHELAIKGDYFKDKPAVRDFRALTRVYFLLIRHYDLYRKANSIFEISGNRLDDYLNGVSFDVDSIFKSSSNLVECINMFSRLVSDLLHKVYIELEIGLSFSEFLLFTELPQIMEQELRQVQFLLKRSPSYFNIYFFASEVLNADISEMMRSDKFLLKRLLLVTGCRIASCSDTSSLALAVQNEDNSAFLKVQDLDQFQWVYVDMTSVSNEVKEMISKMQFGEDTEVIYVANRVQCFERLTGDNTTTNTVLITHCHEQIIDMLQDWTCHVSILLTMPLPKTTYRRVVKHDWSNVYLLSMKNSVVEVDPMFI